jgi:hypothetical protein
MSLAHLRFCVYSQQMYSIRRDATKGVVLVCSRCPHEIKVQDFDPSKGHPRTQAAAKMLEHVSDHDNTRLQAPPKDAIQRSWWM